MDWLNYHHLLYFWTVAKHGSITRACEQLHLAQPTISAQIRALETSMGQRLFTRAGRNLVLTDTGQLVYRYAEDIFSLGREMVDTLRGQSGGRPARLVVGVADVVPKTVAYHLLAPALELPERVHIICNEGRAVDLLADLSLFHLDLVISDVPIGPQVKVRAFNHLLGECGITIVAAPALARRARGKFPQCLNGFPLLIPGESSILRRNLEQWLDQNGIRPTIAGEFQDSALLKAFGQAGAGAFPIPAVVEKEICRQFNVRPIGRLDEVRERFYAISVERRIKHPAVVAICESARKELFAR